MSCFLFGVCCAHGDVYCVKNGVINNNVNNNINNNINNNEDKWFDAENLHLSNFCYDYHFFSIEKNNKRDMLNDFGKDFEQKSKEILSLSDKPLFHLRFADGYNMLGFGKDRKKVDTRMAFLYWSPVAVIDYCNSKKGGKEKFSEKFSFGRNVKSAYKEKPYFFELVDKNGHSFKFDVGQGVDYRWDLMFSSFVFCRSEADRKEYGYGNDDHYRRREEAVELKDGEVYTLRLCKPQGATYILDRLGFDGFDVVAEFEVKAQKVPHLENLIAMNKELTMGFERPAVLDLFASVAHPEKYPKEYYSKLIGKFLNKLNLYGEYENGVKLRTVSNCI